MVLWLLQSLEQGRREIAFGGGGQDGDDALARHVGRDGPTSQAAVKAAPEEMPTGMPPTSHLRAMAKALALETVRTSSITPRLRFPARSRR